VTYAHHGICARACRKHIGDERRVVHQGAIQCRNKIFHVGDAVSMSRSLNSTRPSHVLVNIACRLSRAMHHQCRDIAFRFSFRSLSPFLPPPLPDQYPPLLIHAHILFQLIDRRADSR